MSKDFKLPDGVTVYDPTQPTREDKMWQLMEEFLESFDLIGWMYESYIPSDVKKKYIAKFLSFGEPTKEDV